MKKRFLAFLIFVVILILIYSLTLYQVNEKIYYCEGDCIYYYCEGDCSLHPVYGKRLERIEFYIDILSSKASYVFKFRNGTWKSGTLTISDVYKIDILNLIENLEKFANLECPKCQEQCCNCGVEIFFKDRRLKFLYDSRYECVKNETLKDLLIRLEEMVEKIEDCHHDYYGIYYIHYPGLAKECEKFFLDFRPEFRVFRHENKTLIKIAMKDNYSGKKFLIGENESLVIEINPQVRSGSMEAFLSPRIDKRIENREIFIRIELPTYYTRSTSLEYLPAQPIMIDIGKLDSGKYKIKIQVDSTEYLENEIEILVVNKTLQTSTI